jgi:thymidylate kinase
VTAARGMPGDVAQGSSSVPASLERLFAALSAAGVAWCLLRPRAALAHPGGDVDLLVEPRALPHVAQLLEREGFLRMTVAGADVHGVAYDAASDSFPWVHVQGELRLAGAVVPAAEVLAGAAGEPLREPADAWLLWILLLRALIDKGALPERHRPSAQALAGGWRGGPERLVALAREHRLAPERIVDLAAKGDWDGLLAHAEALPPRAGPSRRIVRSLHDLRGRRGLAVAVIGPDGAGKSTLVEGLARSLPVATTIEYMGLTGGRMPQADALRVPGLVLAARLLILWVRWGRCAYHRARGRIVLIDRYTLDGAVPSGIRLGPLGRVSRRVQRRACPMPDLVLLLDASGTTMHRRKGEYDPAELEVWRAAYARLLDKVRALEAIDAEQPAEAVRREAQERVWRRYSRQPAGWRRARRARAR